MQVTPREKAALEYSDALKERFKHLPEIKRISRYAPRMASAAATHVRASR